VTNIRGKIVIYFDNRKTMDWLYNLGSLKKSFLLSLRSKEGAVAISALMILRSQRRFAFAKLIVMT